MFDFLGRLITTHPWKICITWVVFIALLGLIAPSWDANAQDDDVRFLPERCDSVRGYQLLEQAFPQEVFASNALFTVERSDRKLNDQDLALIDRLVADLEALRQQEPELQIGKIHSLRDPFVGKRLLSEDGQCTLIKVSLGTPYLALKTRQTVNRLEARLRQRITEEGPETPSLFTTGPAGVGRDLTSASASSLHNTTWATILLVVVVLLLVYRAPLLALVPLGTIAVSVWVALKVLALMTLIPGFYLVNISKIFAIVLLYGAGTDYCLFLISRYREELAKGEGNDRSLRRSIKAVGGALVASGATVICGLGLMGCAEFTKIRCAGPAIALSLGVLLMASLTLTPAVLHLLGSVAFWPLSSPQPRANPSREDLWSWISRQVMARPLAVWGVAVLLLLPLALLGTRLQSKHSPISELSPNAESVRGLEIIQRHFTAGETGPITLLLASNSEWTTPEGTLLVDHLSRSLTYFDNVAEVRSLTQPLGKPLPLLSAFKPPAQKHLLAGLMPTGGPNSDLVREITQKKAREFYVTRLPDSAVRAGQPRHCTRLDVVLHSNPFDPKSVTTLEQIQAHVREVLPRVASGQTIRSECYGFTVSTRDLARTTESDRSRINFLVLGGIFLILLVVVRKPWLAVYLLVTVLFSYFATLGATALFNKLVLGLPLTEVEWRVPFFLFIVLVAVGEDYNILLMKRVLQERRRSGDEQGMKEALARTGGTISACGIIMAGTFATLMLAGLGTLVQIGFALAFGVLLDTFVVRPVLVPAFTLLVWRWKAKKEGREQILQVIPQPQPQHRAAA